MKQKEQVKKFLEAIFSGLKGFIEIRTINSDKDIKQFFYLTGDIERLLNDFDNDNEFFKGSNIYFGVCPRKEKIGKEDNVKQVNCLWIDFDCDCNEERELNLKKLNSFDPSPSIIVCSGNGYHCYWLLTNPFQINSNKNKLFIKGILKGLCKKLKADHCFDLSRVLRVPYTYNLKDPNNPLPVKIISINPEIKYKILDFEHYKVELDDIEVFDIKLENVEIPKGFYEIREKDQKLKDTWERNRPDLEDRTRSGYDMSLANLLVSYDFNDSEIAAIMKKSPSGKNKDATMEYLKHTIGKARVYWENRNKKSDVESKDAVQKVSKSKFNPRPYSEKILSEYHLKYDKYKRFWIYDKEEGIWKQNAKEKIKSMLRKTILTEKDYKRHCVDEVIADLKDFIYSNKVINDPDLHLIPLNNGIYDLENGQIIQYAPKYFFINKLPVNYNPDHKECSELDVIFSQFVSQENIITLRELIAYCLYRGYPYHKFFILYGDGANGKSTFIKILQKIIGKENISTVSSSDFQNNRFAPGRLFGKLVNAGAEMDYKALQNTSKLKQITGEDNIECEKKFKDAFNFCNYAKLMFLSNQLPVTLDKSDAFYRRIFLIEFPNKFEAGNGADPMIVEKIPQEEIEGLLYQCLGILKDLIKRRFVFTKHEETERIIEKYEKLSNPLKTFLDEKAEKDIDSYIRIGEFKDKFTDYLKENNYNLWTPQKLNREMKEEGFIPITKENTRVWIGIKWK